MSGATPVQSTGPSLSGQGVLIGIVYYAVSTLDFGSYISLTVDSVVIPWGGSAPFIVGGGTHYYSPSFIVSNERGSCNLWIPYNSSITSSVFCSTKVGSSGGAADVQFVYLTPI